MKTLLYKLAQIFGKNLFAAANLVALIWLMELLLMDGVLLLVDLAWFWQMLFLAFSIWILFLGVRYHYKSTLSTKQLWQDLKGKEHFWLCAGADLLSLLLCYWIGWHLICYDPLLWGTALLAQMHPMDLAIASGLPVGELPVPWLFISLYRYIVILVLAFRTLDMLSDFSKK